MEALHVQVPPPERSGRLALAALDCALAAARSGEVVEPIARVDAEVFRDLGDGGDVMDFVDVCGHAARAENVDAGVQFQGRSSSSR